MEQEKPMADQNIGQLNSGSLSISICHEDSRIHAELGEFQEEL